MDGRYQLVELVGSGGFGQVWKAHDPRIGRWVAVKVLLGANTDEQVARFHREASVAGGLAHPGIVTVHDFGNAVHENGWRYSYLVMELLPGRPLSARLENGPMPLPEALGTGCFVVRALAAAHGAGLVHRDIKPSNIILGDDVKLVDFGISRSPEQHHDLTATGVVVGSPTYMAPECFTGTFDHHSDLYSLGCVLYEMVTGRPPFDGRDFWQLGHQHRHEQPPPPSTLRKEAPRPLDDPIARLLAKTPDKRPADADEVYRLLYGIYDRGEQEPPRGRKPPRDRKPRRGADVDTEVTLNQDADDPRMRRVTQPLAPGHARQLLDAHHAGASEGDLARRRRRPARGVLPGRRHPRR
ncbi:serine/threonine-protein kinase, partial [Streptomyces sp. SID3343]|uniref:serine/threonine-protein kinase n=1 Tax=Streptomyces sp. SID3343 TaxID=2690260 RepID=UPI0031FA2C18